MVLNGVSSWCSQTLESRDKVLRKGIDFARRSLHCWQLRHAAGDRTIRHAVVQSRGRVRRCDASGRGRPGSPSFTISRSLLRSVSVEAVMLLSHRILCRPLSSCFQYNVSHVVMELCRSWCLMLTDHRNNWKKLPWVADLSQCLCPSNGKSNCRSHLLSCYSWSSHWVEAGSPALHCLLISDSSEPAAWHVPDTQKRAEWVHA